MIQGLTQRPPHPCLVQVGIDLCRSKKLVQVSSQSRRFMHELYIGILAKYVVICASGVWLLLMSEQVSSSLVGSVAIKQRSRAA